MTRNEKQMRAYRAEMALERLLLALGLELARGTDRRHLVILWELATLHVEHLGPTLLAVAYQQKLDALYAEIATTTNASLLRLVQ